MLARADVLRDLFFGCPAPTTPATQYMTTTAGTRVQSQREAADYYCEHAAWVLSSEGSKAGSSIARDSAGQPLVGFIHTPGALDVPGAANRHTQTAEVVGAALRGTIDTARSTASPVKVLLTGFGPFQNVTDNPTGDFVSSAKNVDAAMRAAYGDALLGPGTPAGSVLVYAVRDAETGKTFEVQVLAKQLEVSDAAIDGGPQSLQALLSGFKPQVAISLGVDPRSRSYDVVVRSDRGGLEESGGKLRHSEDKRVRCAESKDGELFNDALGRAIQRGSTAPRPRRIS